MAEYFVDDQLRCHVDVVAGWAACDEVVRVGTEVGVSEVIVHALLRSAINSAVKRRLIPYSPANHIELAPENPKRPKPWTAEQCQIFLKHASEPNDRLGSLYQLLLVTGMRRGEAIGLRWEDLDFEGKTLSLWCSRSLKSTGVG